MNYRFEKSLSDNAPVYQYMKEQEYDRLEHTEHHEKVCTVFV